MQRRSKENYKNVKNLFSKIHKKKKFNHEILHRFILENSKKAINCIDEMAILSRNFAPKIKIIGDILSKIEDILRRQILKNYRINLEKMRIFKK